MRNTKRHKYVVGRNPDVDDETVIEWFWESGFVQPTSATALLSRSTGVQQDEIKLKTQGDKPTILELVDSQSVIIQRPDYVYWGGKWWMAAAQSQWLQMGRNSFNTFGCQYNTRAAFNSQIPPAFETEFDPFIEVVGSLERIVELSLKSLINKIGE